MTPPAALSIAGCIEETAARRPVAAAVIDRDRRVTFSELSSCVERLASWLAREGLAPGDVVGITLRDNFQHLLATLALMRLGCAQVALSRRDSRDVRRALAERCGVSVILAAVEEDAFDGLASLRPDFATAFAHAGPPGLRLPPPDIHAPALLCASSGTTGRAKIMAISQAQLLDRAALWKLGGPGKVVYRAMSLDIDIAKREDLSALINGATILVTVPRDARDIVHMSRAHEAEMLLLSPGQARDLVAVAEAAGARLFGNETAIQISGGAASAAFCRVAHRWLAPRIEIRYGASECGTTTEGGLDMFEIDVNAVGYVLTGATVEAVDEEDRPLPPGALGRLRIRTPGMLFSYWDDNALSAQVFRDGWFYPGDVGRVTADGLLIYEGRVDEMMILDSLNIFPAEIERIVERFPGVIDCAAFAQKSPVHGDIPVVAVVAGDGFDHPALVAHCRRHLGVRTPRRIILVAELPRNDTGKILRRELPALLAR